MKKKSKPNHLRLNQSGFTLAEAVVSLGIMAVTLYVLPEIFKNTYMAESMSRKMLATQSTGDLVKLIIEDADRCTDALQGQDIRQTMTIFRKSIGNQPKQPILTAGQSAGEGWVVEDIRIRGITLNYGNAMDNLLDANGDGDDYNFMIDLGPKWNSPNYLTMQNGQWVEMNRATNQVARVWNDPSQYFEFGPPGSETRTNFLAKNPIYNHLGYALSPENAISNELVSWDDAFESIPVETNTGDLEVTYRAASDQTIFGTNRYTERFQVELATVGPEVMYCSPKTGRNVSFEEKMCRSMGGLYNVYNGGFCDYNFRREWERVGSCLQLGDAASLVVVDGSEVPKCMEIFTANCYRDYFKTILMACQGSWDDIVACAALNIIEFESFGGLNGNSECTSQQ